jgi:flagellin-specific chaperone FliS
MIFEKADTANINMEKNLNKENIVRTEEALARAFSILTSLSDWKKVSNRR